MHHTWQPSHIPRDCPAKISGVPLSRSRARVRRTLRAMEYRAERSGRRRGYAQGVYSSLRMRKK